MFFFSVKPGRVVILWMDKLVNDWLFSDSPKNTLIDWDFNCKCTQNMSAWRTLSKAWGLELHWIILVQCQTDSQWTKLDLMFFYPKFKLSIKVLTYMVQNPQRCMYTVIQNVGKPLSSDQKWTNPSLNITFLGSGPKGPMSCRTQGRIFSCPSILQSIHPSICPSICPSVLLSPPLAIGASSLQSQTWFWPSEPSN